MHKLLASTHKQAVGCIITPSTKATSPPFFGLPTPASIRLLPSHVLNLQRHVGNRATIAFLNRSQSSIQRRPTGGLVDKRRVSRFASEMYQLYRDPSHSELPVGNLTPFISDMVNDYLGLTRTPEVEIIETSEANNYGSFDMTTWQLAYNPKVAFGEAETLGEVTEADMQELTDTLYHEARHAEQNFRQMRLRANALIPDPESTTPKQILQAAQTLRDQTGIPERVLIVAVSNPLKFGSKEAKRLGREADVWESSTYGKNSAYREFVLGQAKTTVTDLRTYTQLLSSGVPLFDEDPQERIKVLIDLIKLQHIGEAEKIIGDLQKRKHKKGFTMVEKRMLESMTEIRSGFNRILANYRFIGAHGIGREARALESVFYDAYRNLPEESDAWQVGKKAGKAFGRHLARE